MSDTSKRKAEIVEWLATSETAHKFKTGTGFFVSKGSLIRLMDSRVVDLLDWLLEEGVTNGIDVAGYSVVYAPKGEYSERLNFFTKPAIAHRQQPINRPSSINNDSVDEIDEKDLKDRVNDYYEEIGSYREDSARSSNEGWFHPESEGSREDNCSNDE